MGLEHALIDAYWIICDRCGDPADNQNHGSRGSATTRAEDAGFVERNGEWFCEKCPPTPTDPPRDTPKEEMP